MTVHVSRLLHLQQMREPTQPCLCLDIQNNGGHEENSENHTKALFIFLVVKILNL